MRRNHDRGRAGRAMLVVPVGTGEYTVDGETERSRLLRPLQRLGGLDTPAQMLAPRFGVAGMHVIQAS